MRTTSYLDVTLYSARDIVKMFLTHAPGEDCTWLPLVWVEDEYWLAEEHYLTLTNRFGPRVQRCFIERDSSHRNTKLIIYSENTIMVTPVYDIVAV